MEVSCKSRLNCVLNTNLEFKCKGDLKEWLAKSVSFIYLDIKLYTYVYNNSSLDKLLYKVFNEWKMEDSILNIKEYTDLDGYISIVKVILINLIQQSKIKWKGIE